MRDHFDPAYDAGPLILSSPEAAIAPHSNFHSASFSAAAEAVTLPATRSSFGLEISPRSSRITDMSSTEEMAMAGLKRQVSHLYDGESPDSDCKSPLNCQSLQSSLKRVKLSCSPGELRLQRDLKMLSPQEWHPVEGNPSTKSNQTPTTWVHLPTQARLRLVDSLRLYLFLPTDIAYRHVNTNPSQQQNHYHWRMMIQIPRMFPHRPPVVSRMEGNLWVNQIVIDDAPPARSKLSESLLSPPFSLLEIPHAQSQNMPDKRNEPASSPSHVMSAQTEDEPYQVCGGGKTIVWNKWSPVVSLGDLLDFLLTISQSERPLIDASRPGRFQTSSRVVSDEGGCGWMWSSSSSSSSFSSFSGIPKEHVFSNNSNACPGMESNESYYREEHKVEGFAMTTMRRSPQAPKFLAPNRFDVGYEKHNNGKMLVFSSEELHGRGDDNLEESMMETS
jgi:hypothetical protein